MATTQRQQQRRREPPPFDLQAYASRYDPRSETRLQRLLFLAHRFHEQRADGPNTNIGGDGPGPSSSSEAVCREAFELAVGRMRQSGNYRRYLEEFGAVEAAPHNQNAGGPAAERDDHPPELAGGGGGGGGASFRQASRRQQRQHVVGRYLEYDPAFPPDSRTAARQRLGHLEGRLSAAQGCLMKESIRTALLALAEFHRETGDLREAWRRAARSREYCGNGRQHSHVCLLMIELSVDLREWPSVRDAISRAEHTALGGSDRDHDPLFHHKLRAAGGLASLAEGKYLEAARSFASISPDLTNEFNSVVSAEDLALYGAVLGLATMDRDNLHAAVIDGPFKGRLELVPAMREALQHHSRAEYRQCLELLQDVVRRDLLLDMHLHAHVPVLLDMIRDRCIVQYFKPYSSVSLERMGVVFGCSVKEMEDIVVKLISDGGVDGTSLGGRARIDALNKTLSVEKPESVERRARRRARVMAAKMGVQFTRNAEGMIMRMACIENGITVQGDRRHGWRNRTGRAGRDGGRGPDRMIGPDHFESDDSISDDAMDIDNHVVNPNEF